MTGVSEGFRPGTETRAQSPARTDSTWSASLYVFALGQARTPAAAAAGTAAEVEVATAGAALEHSESAKVKCLAVTCDLHLPDEQWGR